MHIWDSMCTGYGTQETNKVCVPIGNLKIMTAKKE